MSRTAPAQVYQSVSSAICNITLRSFFQTSPKFGFIPS